LSNPRGTQSNLLEESKEAYGNRIAFDSYSRNEEYQRPAFIKSSSKIVYDLSKRKAASTLRGRKLAKIQDNSQSPDRSNHNSSMIKPENPYFILSGKQSTERTRNQPQKFTNSQTSAIG
jgi:hypothetical protein